MRRQGYFTRFVLGSERSIASYGLICPGVALSVLAMFFIHWGLIRTEVFDRSGGGREDGGQRVRQENVPGCPVFDRGMTGLIDIGEVVRRTGVPVSTLHVWERRGLIAPVGRIGLRRQYGQDVIRRIAVVVLCRRNGFTLAEIARVLEPGAFDDGKQVLSRKLEELLERRRRLDQAIDGIRHALDCPEPSPLECPVFERELDGVLPVGKDDRRDLDLNPRRGGSLGG
jgi:DNA-binding transcriptional MerR regulator